MESLEKGFSTIKESKAFPHLLAVILAAGNLLNHGKAAGNAKGFKLESLAKLQDTKSSRSARRNLLHVLASFHDDNQMAYNVEDELEVMKDSSQCKSLDGIHI